MYQTDVSASLIQAQSLVDSSEGDDTEWGKNVVRITEFAQQTAGSFASQYNETAWFPVARDTFYRYMEVGICRRGCSSVDSYVRSTLRHMFVRSTHKV